MSMSRDDLASDATLARAEEVCAHLLVFPYLRRDRYRDLVLDEELRAEVDRRLSAVGMELAESFYSDYFSVRLKGSVEADIRFDWASSHRLPRTVVALLVVLWAKLVLPRRAARDRRIDPDEPNLELFPDNKVPPEYVVKVPKEALLAEFGPKFGRSNLLRYLGMLKRLGFIREDRTGRLFEGPLLDLKVDGPRLASEIQNGVLWDLLSAGPATESAGSTAELELDAPEPGDDELPDALSEAEFEDDPEGEA